MKIKKYLLAFTGIIFILFISGLTGLKAQTVTDIDGNVYNTVTIGTQTWMDENLKTTRYNDGTIIPLVGDSMILIRGRGGSRLISLWEYLTTSAYCWYDNNKDYKDMYGALYNAYAVNTKKLCPTGWHVPTADEWGALITYLGGASVAGGKLKEIDTIYWNAPNIGATNETGFTALPGGLRSITGKFYYFGYQGVWYSSTEASGGRGGGGNVGRSLQNDNNGIFYKGLLKNSGSSVRCICGNIPSGINYMNSEIMILYPNPANDRLYLKNINLANTLIMIYDLQGKKVLDRKVDSESIDISNLSNGIYIVKLVCPEITVITKFIKE
jgi:uncharacterized protein (TIGR02145 family)